MFYGDKIRATRHISYIGIINILFVGICFTFSTSVYVPMTSSFNLNPHYSFSLVSHVAGGRGKFIYYSSWLIKVKTIRSRLTFRSGRGGQLF